METQSTIPVTDCIYLKNKDVYCRYMYSEIVYIEAAGSYCNIHLSSKKNLTIVQPLEEIIHFLLADIFIRVHRSYVINIKHVNKYCGNTFYIQDKAIPIGRTYKKEALSHFNIVMKGK